MTSLTGGSIRVLYGIHIRWSQINVPPTPAVIANFKQTDFSVGLMPTSFLWFLFMRSDAKHDLKNLNELSLGCQRKEWRGGWSVIHGFQDTMNHLLNGLGYFIYGWK